MITGKKISDSIVNCKIIKQVNTQENQQRNVSQYFVNKNIKIQPENTLNSHQNLKQIKKEETKKENEAFNQVQIVHRQNEEQNKVRTSKNEKHTKKSLQKYKNDTTKSKKTIVKNNTNDKHLSKQIVSVQKEQKTNINIQSKKQIKKEKGQILQQTKKCPSKKQISLKNQKQSYTQIEKKPAIAKQIQQKTRNKITTCKAENNQPVLKCKQPKIDNQNLNVRNESCKSQTFVKQNQKIYEETSEDQQQQRIIPTPIQIDKKSQKITQEQLSQNRNENNESQKYRLRTNQEEQSLNQFLSSDLVYSKIEHRQQLNSFLKQNDSLMLFKENNEQIEVDFAQIQNKKQQNQQNKCEQSNKQNLSQEEKKQSCQLQNSEIIIIDQKYMNFQLSFQETLLINADVQQSGQFINSNCYQKSSICQLSKKEQKESMLLEQKCEDIQSKIILQKQNYVLAKTDQKISNILKEVSFNQIGINSYTNYKYYQSSDQDSQNEEAYETVKQNAIKVSKQMNFQEQKIQVHKQQTLYQRLEQQNQNSSEQESEQENQAIQAYLKARNMITTAEENKIKNRKQRQFHNQVNVHQNNTILEQSYEQDSCLIQIKKEQNISRISQDLSNLQLFCLQMDELMKKDFIMI